MDENIMSICPICKSKSAIVYENKQMPYGINLYTTTLDLEVGYCKECSFVFQSSAYNESYDDMIQKLYSSYTISHMYDFPNRNQHHLKALDFIDAVIENKIDFNILEIGSNRGDFLFLLKERFPNINVLGCEPTSFKELSVPTLNAFFDKNLFNTKFDLIILRHTLEHVKYPQLFIKEISSLLKTDAQIFIEVPNLIYSLTSFVEDFTPDHVNYFHKDSLKNLFTSFETVKTREDEYLYALYKPAKMSFQNIVSKQDFGIYFEKYNQQLDSLISEILIYERIIFYGISNFYVWTYSKLKNQLKNHELMFIDDFLIEDEINHLPKAVEIKAGDLVILCSSNKNLQNKMFKKLPTNISVVFPWEKIEHV